MYLAIIFSIIIECIFEIMVCKATKPTLSVNHRICINRRFYNSPSLVPTEITSAHKPLMVRRFEWRIWKFLTYVTHPNSNENQFNFLNVFHRFHRNIHKYCNLCWNPYIFKLSARCIKHLVYYLNCLSRPILFGLRVPALCFFLRFLAENHKKLFDFLVLGKQLIKLKICLFFIIILLLLYLKFWRVHISIEKFRKITSFTCTWHKAKHIHTIL